MNDIFNVLQSAFDDRIRFFREQQTHLKLLQPLKINERILLLAGGDGRPDRPRTPRRRRPHVEI
jgi:hypothetical protein